MKRKLFCLLTLLLTVCSGAWAEETIFSYTVVAADLTNQPTTDLPKTYEKAASGTIGGTCTFNIEDTSGNCGYFRNNGGNSYNFGSSNAYVKLTLSGENKFQTGDKISVSFKSNNNKEERGYYVRKTNKSTSDQIASATTSSTATKTVELTAAFNNVQTVYIERTNGISFYSVTVTREAAPREVVSITLDGVKKGSTTLTEGAEEDYTIAGTTITLTNKHKATTAPTDIKLIKKTTYTEGDPDYDDVAVELEKSGSVFTGTATIDETTYTVNVPYDETATLEADKASVTVTSPKIVTGSVTIHLTGANLTGENVSVAFASSVAGLSVDKASIAIADGAVNTDVTVSYKSDEDVAEANVNLVISTEGVSNIVIPVTYSSTAAVTTITDVTDSKTWDFEADKPATTVDSPDQNNVIPFANASGFKSGFAYENLAGKAQFLHNSGGYFQGAILKFHTTVPGSIVVKFSNTGTSERPYRYLKVNDKVTEYKSKTSASTVTTGSIDVPAGDVTLVGIMGTTSDGDCEPTDPEVQNMLRIFSVAFTTADVTAPTLSSSTPANDATDVATSGTIVLTFSEDIASVDDTKFSLSGATKGAVAIDDEDATKVNVAYSGAEFSSTVTLAVAAEAVEDAAGNKSAALSNISFTTTAPVAVTGVTLDKNEAEIEVGENVELTATVAPAEAANKNVTWTSDDEDVATVDANGVVTGVAAGTANITVTTEDGSFTDVCVVTVVAAVLGGDVTFNYSTDDDKEYTGWTKTPITLNSSASKLESGFIQLAAEGTIEVVGANALITKVTVSYSRNNDNPTVTASDGTSVTSSNSGATWSNSAGVQNLTLTFSAKCRPQVITVTYSEAVAVTGNAYNWITFCNGSALDFTGSDVTAYVVTGTSGTALVKEKVTAVAAGTPLMINATEGTHYVKKAATGTDYSTTNCLKQGEDAAVAAVGGKSRYILTLRDKKAAFAIIDEYSPNVPSDKAYLEIEDGGAARSFFFLDDEGETTSLNEVRGLKAEVRGDFYDLSGRKVAQPTKGLYIVNGRKVVIK